MVHFVDVIYAVSHLNSYLLPGLEAQIPKFKKRLIFEI